MPDVAIIGGGAAGLMAGVLLARKRPDFEVIILDGVKRLGAKILISGGGRCNVTNKTVNAKDFNSGSQAVVKRALKAFSAKNTVQFFEELGVPVHEENHGKLFPDSSKARTVLDALTGECQRLGVRIQTGFRVQSVEQGSELFIVHSETQTVAAKYVLLATGGQSVPKTGSDGHGYSLAESFGHSLTPLFPALAPLLLDGTFHESLSGISQDVMLTLQCRQEKSKRFSGALLWTHFGVSGPVVLDLSRHWHVARHQDQSPKVTVNFFPDHNAQTMEQQFLDWSQHGSNNSIRRTLSQLLPNRFVDALLNELNIPLDSTFATFSRENRKQLVRKLVERTLPVIDSRGFQYAEATAGGIPLNEVDPSTMESRCQPGLFLIGEILDVDGRLGGFNFQWAWSSAAVAAHGLSKKALP